MGKSITIIIGAILLPPFGIIPGIRYFLKDDRRAQFVGVTTIVITIIMSALAVLFTINLVNGFSKSYNDILKLQGGAPASTNQKDILNQIQDLQ